MDPVRRRRSLFPCSDNDEDSDLGPIHVLEDSGHSDEDEDGVDRFHDDYVVQTPDHTVVSSPMELSQRHRTPHEMTTTGQKVVPKLTRKSVSGTACSKRKRSPGDSPGHRGSVKFEPKNPKIRTTLFPESMDDEHPQTSPSPSPFSIPPDKFYSNQEDIMDLIRKRRRSAPSTHPVRPATRPDKSDRTIRKRPGKRPRVANYDAGTIKDYLESYRELNKENEAERRIVMPKVPGPDGSNDRTVAEKRLSSPDPTEQPRKFFKSTVANRTVTSIKSEVDNEKSKLLKERPVENDSFMSDPDDLTGLVDIEGIITSLDDTSSVSESNKIVVQVFDPKYPTDDSILIHAPPVPSTSPVHNLRTASNISHTQPVVHNLRGAPSNKPDQVDPNASRTRPVHNLRGAPSNQSDQVDPILSPISQMCNVTSGLALDSPKRGTNLTAQLSRMPGLNVIEVKEKPRKRLRRTDNDQMIIDAGQRRIGEVTCPTCNLMYLPGDKKSEDYHEEYHKGNSYFRFSGWRHERVVTRFLTGKIIQVKPEDSKLWWKKCISVISYVNQELGCCENERHYMEDHQVFLYVQKQRIVGFLLATSKSEAHRILPVEPDKPDRITEEVFPIRCGVSRIWVSSLCRKGGIGRALMDSLKVHFMYGTVLRDEDIAITPPTEMGRIFAERYFKSSDFLVYLP